MPLEDFPKPAVTIDSIVFGYDGVGLSVLLLNRREAPFANMWTLPGGFLQIHETFEACAARILVTKTGLRGLYLEQLYTFGGIERDPRDRVLSVAYYALVNPLRYKLIAGQAANEVRWFKLNALPTLGFDHKDMIQTAYARLRGKVRYNPIGFELLDQRFTFQELHQLYEIILAKEINRGNFWKKIRETGLLRHTGERRVGGKHRAPELFEFDRDKYAALSEHGFEFLV